MWCFSSLNLRPEQNKHRELSPDSSAGKGLDGLVARKRSLLETVKETETFKVAKEILEKYDQESPKSLSQPSSPTTEKRPTGNRRGQPARVDQHETTLPHMDSDQPGADGTNRPPVKTLYTKSFESIPSVEVGPMRAVPARSRLKPIRPFQRESTTIVDKMVDYFFGDGPSQRFALICSNCHGHNGMAVPAEYDYLAFVCFICGHFNPAKKFRPSHISTTPLPSTPRSLKPNVALDAHKISNSSLEQANDEQEKLNNRERKGRLPQNSVGWHLFHTHYYRHCSNPQATCPVNSVSWRDETLKSLLASASTTAPWQVRQLFFVFILLSCSSSNRRPHGSS
ncbi:hypothetical protein Y032_1050g3495 [Ancylostoma ceylanicum]|uniref:Endoplasmic reticulum junction formation protein lunapark n=1 Tax=Ancylostoma ceylanicum TaxID=53326 RepID=A0A016W6J6_9BILA|nr:hypothetical protein Y032_1050g3495 [Ancylostoma ceylanicum]